MHAILNPNSDDGSFETRSRMIKSQANNLD